MEHGAVRQQIGLGGPRLGREFYRRDPVTVAKELLGQRLVRIVDGRRLAGLIVETEAYLGVGDKAAHSCRGRRTARNNSMWLDGGHAYVYFTYGMHYCFNVVTDRQEIPTAVLVRALEPTEGLEVMAKNRGLLTKETVEKGLFGLGEEAGGLEADVLYRLCSGPARLCQAMAIDRRLDGVDLVTSEVFFIERARRGRLREDQIVCGPRVGVAYAEEWADKPLRFYLRGNRFVSRP